MKRKGFNFVVKSTNVETEKVDFNQLTKKPDTSKRDITTTTNNNKRTKKAYYPKSTYQYANDSSNLSHTEKLKIIIDKVSQVESATLKSYFKKLSEETGSSTEIYEHLVNVLETSVQDIRNSCPDDVQFQPEFPSKERKALASSSSETHVNPMETKLSLLTTAYEMLQQYEFDVNEFVASVAPSIESAASADGAEASSSSSAVSSAAGTYKETLHSLQTSCDSVLSLLGTMETQLGTAQDAQSELYEAFRRSQLDPKLPSNASTKDIIKAMQS